jgi:hypothetical protein
VAECRTARVRMAPLGNEHSDEGVAQEDDEQSQHDSEATSGSDWHASGSEESESEVSTPSAQVQRC